jgi:hypothetical protein
MRKNRVTPGLLLLLLGACASTPDVTVQYYPARAITTFTTTQNVACTHDDMTLIVANTVTATTEYSADTTKPPHRLHVKDLDNPLADASLSVDLFGDGRLKGINASSTGQGQAVISAGAELAGVLVPLAGASPGRAPSKLPACAVLKNWSDGKAALSFVKSVDLAQLSVGTAVTLNDDKTAMSDPALYERLSDVLPEISLEVSQKSSVPRPAAYAPGDDRDALELTLHDTSTVRLDFHSTDRISFGRHWLGAKIVTIPGPDDYVLPIPKAALFGGQTFSLTLSESGAVTALSYGKTSGAPAALGAANSVATTITPPAAAP